LDFELTNIFGTCNNFAVLYVNLVNAKLHKKNLDYFLTNILQVQSQAILQELQEKRVIALIFYDLAISPQARTMTKFITKGREYLKDKNNESSWNSKIKNITDLCTEINEFRKGYQPRIHLIKAGNGNLLSHPQTLGTDGRTTFFSY
jgi:hypothetical protein